MIRRYLRALRVAKHRRRLDDAEHIAWAGRLLDT